MKLILKIILKILLLVFIPIVFLTVFELFVFLPNQGPTKIVLDNASHDCKNPSNLVIAGIKSSGGSGMALPVSNYGFMKYKESSGTPLGWHLSSALWHFLTSIHYSESEMLTIFCAAIWNGEDYGLDSYSQKQFGKSLNSLALQELSSVIAITHAPSYYKKHPEKHRDRTEYIESRIKESL